MMALLLSQITRAETQKRCTVCDHRRMLAPERTPHEKCGSMLCDALKRIVVFQDYTLTDTITHWKSYSSLRKDAGRK
jgi:hypothetical protein